MIMKRNKIYGAKVVQNSDTGGLGMEIKTDTSGAGVVRKLDELHRLVIPQEYCRLLKWDGGTPLEVTRVGRNLIISCYEKRCSICGHRSKLTTVNNISICQDCLKQFNTAAGIQNEEEQSR